MNYKDSGVDVAKGDLFIDRIKPFIKDTYNENVHSGVGGFAALYDLGDRYLASGTDGVGTKLKLATELDIHDTIGIDLVAMCVNDILCTGASPLFFLDYLATSSLNLDTHEKVVKGITQGCKLANCALIGGETAEMPGMYQNGEYDLAGFAIGDLDKSKVIDGTKVKSGMKILALKASGFHSNGFSLIRRLIENESLEFKAKCLTPTKIYVSEAKELLNEVDIVGMAHITGGGLNNIKRMNENFGYEINFLPQMPEFMDITLTKSKLSLFDLYTTFNMGVGFVFVTENASYAKHINPNLIEIGTVTEDFQGVKVFGQMI